MTDRAVKELSKKKCVPCEGGVPKLGRRETQQYLASLPSWKRSENGNSIQSEYNMKSFMAAVDFINEIAQVAESENHHPDLHLTGYRKLVIELSTHAIGGLSENDFILAAKIDQLPKKLKA